MRRTNVFLISTAIAAAVLASCAGVQKGAGPRQDAGGPGPDRGTETLMRILALTREEGRDTSLAVTAAQASELLPVLRQWKGDGAALGSGSAKAEAYAKRLESLLTTAQRAYRPRMEGPGSQGPGGSGAPYAGSGPGSAPPPPAAAGQAGGAPGGGAGSPQGGPGGPDTGGLLDELIEALSQLQS